MFGQKIANSRLRKIDMAQYVIHEEDYWKIEFCPGEIKRQIEFFSSKTWQTQEKKLLREEKYEKSKVFGFLLCITWS